MLTPTAAYTNGITTKTINLHFPPLFQNFPGNTSVETLNLPSFVPLPRANNLGGGIEDRGRTCRTEDRLGETHSTKFSIFSVPSTLGIQLPTSRVASPRSQIHRFIKVLGILTFDNSGRQKAAFSEPEVALLERSRSFQWNRIPETTARFEERRDWQNIQTTDLRGAKAARPRRTSVLSGKPVDCDSQ